MSVSSWWEMGNILSLVKDGAFDTDDCYHKTSHKTEDDCMDL